MPPELVSSVDQDVTQQLEMVAKLLGRLAQNVLSLSLIMSVKYHGEILTNLCEASLEIGLLLSLKRDTSSRVTIVHLDILSEALHYPLWPWRS